MCALLTVGVVATSARAGDVPHPTRDAAAVVGVGADGVFVARVSRSFEDAADAAVCGYPALPEAKQVAGVALLLCRTQEAGAVTCETFPIYDAPREADGAAGLVAASCTGDKVAAERLARAKKAFTDAGVSLEEKGEVLPLEGEGADAKLRVTLDDGASPGGAITLSTRGNFELWLTPAQGPARRVLKETPPLLASRIGAPHLARRAGVIVLWISNGADFMPRKAQRGDARLWPQPIALRTRDLASAPAR